MVIDDILYAAGPGKDVSSLNEEIYFKLIDAIMTSNLAKIEIFRIV